MAITFNSVESLSVVDQLGKNRQAVAKNLARLSSGLRINSAADDPAGLAIAQAMGAEVRSLSQAERSANDGVSMIQTADSALDEVSGVLGRMRELAVQSANGTLSGDARAAVDTEFQQLKAEIDRIANTTEFNGTTLLDQATSLTFQVGIDAGAAENTITVSTADVNVAAIGQDGGGADSIASAGVATVDQATTAIGSIDRAISEISSARAQLGSGVNRLNSTIDFLATQRENLSAAMSRIRDADVAEETANRTRNMILVQGSVALLAQANVLPSVGLLLLGGK
ncbi:MAG: flagellin [Pseudomonadota bacterium]